MPLFDFKAFHVRSIRAADDTERIQINTELKALYASLNEEEKAIFNTELQRFLVKEVNEIGAEYQAIRQQNLN